MRACWKAAKPPELERRIKANDHGYNAQFEYADNYICTSKYNIATFLPKNLFEQFQRIANAYFLCLLILQLIPQISSLPYYSTVVPLVIVLTLSATKDAIDDVRRHVSDAQVNNRESSVLRNGRLVQERWHKVIVGDIIKMENNQFVAADLLLLSTSEPNSLCYIETAELDGETNLKVRQALVDTAAMGNNEDLIGKFEENAKSKGLHYILADKMNPTTICTDPDLPSHTSLADLAELVCEPPNNRLSKFEGRMKWKDKQYSLDNDKLLLRGCVLRNTKWCYGLVIFAGKDTKLMMNSGKTVFKRTNIDRLMNVLIIGIFIFLLSICLGCTIACGIWETLLGYRFQVYLPWESFVPNTSQGTKAGSTAEGATVISLLVFFSYIIILNTVVPISLYVSVEIIRLFNSLWINWDNKMYYKKKDTPAKARTTTLNEELGQIEYIFSDKTGTLTQNIMEFRKCSINGKSYGTPIDRFGNPIAVTDEGALKVDFSQNPYSENNFEFFDHTLLDEVRQGNPKVYQFFLLLALCHTVMPEEKEDGGLEYQAQSPDEGALVSATRNFGFVFKSRTPKTITIEIHGNTLVYDLLCILDFDNVRKRMSVIVRDPKGKIQLLCKGADTVINERLHPSSADLRELTNHHLNEFAQEGLRTLNLAFKDIAEKEWEAWEVKHHEASISLENRDEKLSALYEEIEKNLTLIGATAIEDKLQDGVPETIANLAMAGIKIWVLTGDKQETAVNIGYSCQLLTDDMEEVFIIDAEEFKDVEIQMKNAIKQINESKKTVNHQEAGVHVANGSVTFSNENGNVSLEGDEETFALVINGHSLVHCLTPDLEFLLLELGCSCKAVICCRVTPLQKALVVDLIKRNKKSITLAIGDGANDVSMIKTAHIGVGISGQEGMQAVLASDFSISQFRYLEKLLLVHGRWSYLRMCKFLKYFFYKNFAFTLCHFWFAFFCGFSAQTLFDPYFISFYNLFFSSLPILALGIFDQDVDEYYSLRYPKLYHPGLVNLLFNKWVFNFSAVEGILTSIVLFFIPYGAFYWAISPWGVDLADQQSFATVVSSSLVVAVNLRCALETAYWTPFNHVVIWGSIIYYFCFFLLMYATGVIWYYQYIGVANAVFASANFWLCLLLTNVILILPIVAYKFYMTSIRTTLSDRIRMKQRLTKSRTKADLPIRRQSTLRRSTRSMRSGYAFSHQSGFGELITSGINMRERARSNDAKTPVILTNVKKLDGTSTGKKRAVSPTPLKSRLPSEEQIIYSEKL